MNILKRLFIKKSDVKNNFKDALDLVSYARGGLVPKKQNISKPEFLEPVSMFSPPRILIEPALSGGKIFYKVTVSRFNTNNEVLEIFEDRASANSYIRNVKNRSKKYRSRHA